MKADKRGSRSFVYPDDIEVGGYIAVHSLSEPPRPINLFENDEEGPVFLRRRGTQIPYGAPIRVRGLQLPYIFGEVMFPGESIGSPALIDTRLFRLMRVSDEYVESIVTFKKRAPRKEDATEK